ncbi:MAG: zinc ribbon domain-containing protein, partial [Muribaculaceae bacterium]|nr:zinc ribbon domain-containing protein [Muribaculaceae bacterium]
MKCPSCHKDIEENRKFCPFCGVKLPRVNYCTNCGKELDPNKKFCEKCGFPNPQYSQKDKSYPIFSQGESFTPLEQASEQSALSKDSSSSGSLISEIDSRGERESNYSQNISNIDSVKVEGNVESNIHQEEEIGRNNKIQELDTSELPVYEELESSGSSHRWIAYLLAIIVLAGGVMILGQRLNWWNINALSWAGGGNALTEMVDTLEYSAEEPEVIVDAEEVVESEDTVGEPYSVTLIGT